MKEASSSRPARTPGHLARVREKLLGNRLFVDRSSERTPTSFSASAEEHGIDGAFEGALLQAGDDVLLAEGHLLEELLGQVVVGAGRRVHEHFTGLFDGVVHVRGNVDLDRLLAGRTCRPSW